MWEGKRPAASAAPVSGTVLCSVEFSLGKADSLWAGGIQAGRMVWVGWVLGGRPEAVRLDIAGR